LLLSSVAPTLVSRDRRAGVIAIERDRRHPTVVIMDDGLQNAAVAKDIAIALVDGKRGIGNGEVIPAGPLRAPFEFQLGLVDTIVVRDPPDDGGDRSVLAILKQGFPGPVLTAAVGATGDTSWIGAKPLLAFAGIANPRRFYRLLEDLGGHLLEPVSFPDHHWFAASDAEQLLGLAQAKGAQLVTTEKDYARLRDDPTLAALAAATRVLPIEMRIGDRELGRLNSLIEAALQGTTRRQRPPLP
jgi:tetraacyldisaccharide 4'-kinase